MSEICFRFSHSDAIDSLWLRPLVPELALGLGGRIVDCVSDAPDDQASEH
jgi:hypothetical protein